MIKLNSFQGSFGDFNARILIGRTGRMGTW